MSIPTHFASKSHRRRSVSRAPFMCALESRQLLSAAVSQTDLLAKHAASIVSTLQAQEQSLHATQAKAAVPAKTAATVKTSTPAKAVAPSKTTATASTKAKTTAKAVATTAKQTVFAQLEKAPGSSPSVSSAGSKSITSSGVTDGNGSQATYSPVVGAYGPAQLRTAYGVSSLGLANEGQGVTIAIVDELDDTGITTDANAYSSYYNLPKFDGVGSDPTLTVLKDTALGSVGSASGTGVAGETSLDVEMAHAMAPYAKILLVEVPATGNTANEFKELLHGVQLAASQTGVVAVSLSYGTSESSVGASNVTSQNSTYLSTGAAANVAVTVSTGDGSSPLYPATSPNVVAVGGTSLYLASVKGSYSLETAWGGLSGAGAGGGGQSTNFATPTFQSSNGVNFAKRAIPDVSMDADVVTGVSVYDSFDASGGDPWTSFGGTSVATPLFSGVIALAQQSRIAAGKSILNSVQVDSAMYGLYNSSSYLSDFHDINQGKNSNVNSSGSTTVAGYSAVTGYDLATGIGSPIANVLDPYLASI